MGILQPVKFAVSNRKLSLEPMAQKHFVRLPRSIAHVLFNPFPLAWICFILSVLFSVSSNNGILSL